MVVTANPVKRGYGKTSLTASFKYFIIWWNQCHRDKIARLSNWTKLTQTWRAHSRFQNTTKAESTLTVYGCQGSEDRM